MTTPIWIGVDAKSPVTDQVMGQMRAALKARWEERGGGKHIETVKSETVLLSGEEVEVIRIDWRTA